MADAPPIKDPNVAKDYLAKYVRPSFGASIKDSADRETALQNFDTLINDQGFMKDCCDKGLIKVSNVNEQGTGTINLKAIFNNAQTYGTKTNNTELQTKGGSLFKFPGVPEGYEVAAPTAEKSMGSNVADGLIGLLGVLAGSMFGPIGMIIGGLIAYMGSRMLGGGEMLAGAVGYGSEAKLPTTPPPTPQDTRAPGGPTQPISKQIEDDSRANNRKPIFNSQLAGQYNVSTTALGQSVTKEVGGADKTSQLHEARIGNVLAQEPQDYVKALKEKGKLKINDGDMAVYSVIGYYQDTVDKRGQEFVPQKALLTITDKNGYARADLPAGIEIDLQGTAPVAVIDGKVDLGKTKQDVRKATTNQIADAVAFGKASHLVQNGKNPAAQYVFSEPKDANAVQFDGKGGVELGKVTLTLNNSEKELSVVMVGAKDADNNFNSTKAELRDKDGKVVATVDIPKKSLALGGDAGTTVQGLSKDDIDIGMDDIVTRAVKDAQAGKNSQLGSLGVKQLDLKKAYGKEGVEKELAEYLHARDAQAKGKDAAQKKAEAQVKFLDLKKDEKAIFVVDEKGNTNIVVGKITTEQRKGLDTSKTPPQETTNQIEQFTPDRMATLQKDGSFAFAGITDPKKMDVISKPLQTDKTPLPTFDLGKNGELTDTNKGTLLAYVNENKGMLDATALAKKQAEEATRMQASADTPKQGEKVNGPQAPGSTPPVDNPFTGTKGSGPALGGRNGNNKPSNPGAPALIPEVK